MVSEYRANLALGGSHFNAINMTFNPAYMGMTGFTEAYSGIGMTADDLGSRLSTWERTLKAGKGVVGTVGTVTAATGIVSVGSNVAKTLAFRGAAAVESAAENAALKFPGSPGEFSKLLKVDPKKVGVTPDGTPRVTWEPNSNTRIRFESHPDGLSPGSPGYNPRHHGPHYHIEVRPDGAGWNQATKLHPEGYTPGSGTGFLPGEKLPGT
jgi:hypothetical protein